MTPKRVSSLEEVDRAILRQANNSDEYYLAFIALQPENIKKLQKIRDQSRNKKDKRK